MSDPRGARVATSAGIALLLLVASSRPAGAQEGIAGACPPVEAEAGRTCAVAAQAAASAQPRLVLAAGGGNPLHGSASTLGRRMAGVPRWTIGLRVEGVRVEALPGREASPGAERGLALSVGADIGVGVLPGVSIAPTIGGIGSLDLILSGGVLRPGGAFEQGAVHSLAAGLRLGILRESFTMPGVSLTGMYRGVGAVSVQGSAGDGIGWRNEVSGLSGRLGASKQLLGVGLTVGAGVDRTRGTGHFLYSAEEGSAPVRNDFDGHVSTRSLLFTNLSYTLIILHLVAEAGWQEGGATLLPAGMPEPAAGAARRGAVFAGISARLTI